MRVIRLLIVIAAVLSVGIFVRLFGPVDSIPRERASELCYNEEIKVTISEKRLSSIPVSRVGILVRITDQRGTVLFDQIIFEDGWWYEDIGEMYKNVRCTDDAIFIGPKFDPEDYYKIPRSTLNLSR